MVYVVVTISAASLNDIYAHIRLYELVVCGWFGNA